MFTAEPQTPMPSPPPLPPADDQPGFWPELARAKVRAPAFEIVAGQNGPATVEYHRPIAARASAASTAAR